MNWQEFLSIDNNKTEFKEDRTVVPYTTLMI